MRLPDELPQIRVEWNDCNINPPFTLVASLNEMV